MSKAAKVSFGIVMILPVLLLWGALIVKGIQFNRKCEGYLKRSADANTVALSKKELAVAVQYLEDNGMTEGFTSILYETPNEDVGFWYNNLRISLDELEVVKPEATQLERSNLLMKLRETLLDDTSSGVEVTVPKGISRFPQNAIFMWMSVVGLIAALGGGLLIQNAFGSHVTLLEAGIVVTILAIIAVLVSGRV